MADTVHYHLERMLPELEDLENRELFSKVEIKEIVKRRRDFEYLLKRRPPLKQDFLRYVEYEKQLEALRKLRKRAISRKLQSNGKKWRISLCDKTGLAHILLIYERAVKRFKGDLTIWLKYLEQCKAGSPKLMQKVLSRALQLHPKVPGLWIYGAAWAFEHELNVKAARVLMQRGLRMCPHAESIWVEYLRMELTYAQKLKARRLLLALEPSPADGGEVVIPVHDEAKLEDTSMTLEKEDNAAESGVEDTLSYNLARTVSRNAIAAIPSSVGLRLRLLEVVDSFTFERKIDIEEEICRSLVKDFPTDESSWDWQARYQISKSGKSIDIAEARNKAIKVYESALESVSSCRMYELYSTFLVDLLDSDTSASVSKREATDDGRLYGKGIVDCLLQLCQRAIDSGQVTDVLVACQLNLLSRLGKLQEARDLAMQVSNLGNLEDTASVWKLRIGLEMQRFPSAAAKSEDWKIIAHLFEKALKCAPLGNAKELWIMAMDFFSGHEDYVELPIGILETALAGGAGGRIGAEVSCTVLESVLHLHGIKQARAVYKRFLALPGPSLQFLKLCLAIEALSSAAGILDAFTHSRRLYSQALQLYGDFDTELWLGFYRLEMKSGNVEEASSLYSKARRTLRDPTSFIERLQGDKDVYYF